MMVETLTESSGWNQAVQGLPGANFLQSWEWGEIKSAYGWEPHRFVWRDESKTIRAAAQVLERKIRFGPVSASVLYAPKGPALDYSNSALAEHVFSDLEAFARSCHAIQIKIDPDLPAGHGIPDTAEATSFEAGIATIGALKRRGWRFSREQIQFRNTVVLSIQEEESQLLAGMKQKTRYNIRLAQKHGVAVRPGTEADFPLLFHMYAETATRDGFILRPSTYYFRVWEDLMRAGFATPLVAEVEHEAVAAIVLFHFGSTALYMHGMSRNLHREKMPNHLLQWEAIRFARSRGCAAYDFWGAPNSFVPSDSMWGVFSFKQGFGGEVVRHIGAWDYPPAQIPYWLYHRVLPQILNVTRRVARRRTASQAAGADA